MADNLYPFIDPGQFAPQLTEAERNLRDVFVGEFLKDFDPFAACIRVGFAPAFAQEYAKTFMAEPYVQQRIAAQQRASVVEGDEESKQDFALIVNGLRQAAQNGPYASRVSALKALAELRGFLKKDEGSTNENALIDAFREFAQKAPA